MSEYIKAAFYKLLPYFMMFLIGLVVGGLGMYEINESRMNDYEVQVAELKAEINDYQIKYQAAISDTEEAKIALAKEKLKEPEKVYIKGDTQTEIVYVEKETPQDPDVQINQEPPSLTVSYNGEVKELPMQTKTESATSEDGTLKVNQSSNVTLDVTDIVNREIANTVLQKDAEIYKQQETIKRLERQKVTSTVLGVIAAGAVGYALNN